MPRILRAIVTSVILASSVHAGVVINEVLYRPGTTVPFTVENTNTEFVELHNTDASAVDISGWALTSGVSFTIPAGTQIPAGGFVVVASNPAALQARYGLAGALGPWAAGGALSNNSERIRLSKPGVTPGSFDKVDDVTYSTEGDWSPRVRETTFNGYDWSSPASVGGRSIELRNPAVSNDNGQNWSSSIAAAGATPGAANSVLTANIPPIIKNVKHFPAVPKTTDPIRISCELNDETAPTGLTATLRWRDTTSTSPGAFATLAMVNDGSGKFTATLPAQTVNLAIVEFYIEAGDGVNTRTFPAAVAGEGQVANCNIQINNEVRTATDTYYDLVLTGAESAAFNTTQATDTAGNKIDRQFNITFISSRAGETSIRYRSSARFRGNSSRDYRVNSVYFKPLRISIPSDDKLDGLTDFAINPRTSITQHLGNRVLQACGLQVPDTIPVELRRNGVELASSTSNTPDFGKWCRVEEFNGDFASNHFPEASGGNLYKKGRPDEFWRTLGTVPSNPDGLLDGWSKQNNSAANDWTDMTNFFAVVQAAAAPYFTGATAGDVNAGNWNNGAFTAADIAQLSTVADLDQWARWFAAMTVLQDNETNISNGQDDDYAIYFAPNALGQRRLNLVTHDLDTIFGLGDSPLAANARGLYDMTAEGSIFKTLLPLIGNSVTTGNAEFRLKYHTALRELLGTVFEQTNFDAMVDQQLGGWAPPATITSIKSFVSQRRTHLLDLIPDGVVGGGTAFAITPPAATSIGTLAATPATSIVIHEILAANETAYANGATFPDVIELRNVSNATVDISGMTLSDDPVAPARYVIPAGTTLNADQILVVHADLATTEPGLHAGFSLDQDGDSVLLYASAANGGALVDSVTFGAQVPDFSIGRTGGTLNTWALCTATIGGANNILPGLPSPALLKINEWGPNPDYLLSSDFVEIFNPSALPAPIGGMRVTDDAINYPSRHVFPALSYIAGNGFLRLNARGSSASPGNSTELAFSFNSSFGSISFFGANGTTVDSVPVIGHPRDTTMGRSPDGSATITRFSLPSSPPTPGSANVAPSTNALDLINSLRITEVLFRPNALEFIELRNVGTSPLDLSGVQFTSGVSYRFESGVSLAAGAYIVVCKDRTAFLAQYGNSVPLAAGVFTGTLDNAGEGIAIQPPAPLNINILNFSYKNDWFVDPTADHSFVVTAPSATAARDWNEKETWQLSVARLGSPGKDEPPRITSALSVSANLNQSFSYQITTDKPATSYGATGLPTGLSIESATGLISGIPEAGGVANVTISATANGETSSALLVISVSVNGPPSFAKGADQTVALDSGPMSVSGWATSISAGPPSESSQTVSFLVSADTPSLFSAQPAVSASGQLTFTPAAHMSGSSVISVVAKDNGGTTGGGIDTSAVQTFTITIQPNRAPSFVKGPDRLLGDTAADYTIPGWATAISAGAGETGQTLSFVVTNTNNALFSVQPAIAPNGTLTFSLPAANPGEATVSVTAVDDGGTMNSGVDSSATQTFKITVVGVNRAPSFTAGADVSVRHNAGPQTLAAWATEISPGPGGEASQTIAFEVGNTNTSLFTSQPFISPGGTLSFTPHPARSGTVTVTATLRDNGGTIGGGVDFVTKTFTITTRAVNDAPSFTAPATISVGVRSDFSASFATNTVAGPSDEAAQTVSFLLSNDRPDLFTSQPTLLASGALTFTAGTKSGTAILTIRAKDSGGTVDGGVDESAPFQLTVKIASALDAIGTYYALVAADTGTTATNESAGFAKITLGKGGAFSGSVVFGGQKFALKGKVDDTGKVAFASTGNNKFRVVYKVFDPGNPKPRPVDRIIGLTMVLTDNPALSGTIDKPAGSDGPARTMGRFRATRPIYNGKTALVPTTILDPAGNKGKFTAAFLALSAPNNGKAATDYPQGDGVGALTVSKTGTVSLKGKLADGTAYSMASAILEGDAVPLYVPLYSAKGSLSGTATARDLAASDIDGAGFFWSRPAITKPVHPGWPAGIFVDLTAAKLLPKATPLFPTLGATDGDGNASVDLTDTTIGMKAVNIDSKNKITVVTAAADKLKVSASASSGALSGSFVSPSTGKTVKFSGVVLRKAGHATGYFLNGIPGGRVRLAPAP